MYSFISAKFNIIQYQTKVLGHHWKFGVSQQQCNTNIDMCNERLCSSHIFTLSRLWYLLLILLVDLLTPVALCKFHLSVLEVTILSVRERCERSPSCWGAVDNRRPHPGLSSTEPVSIASQLIIYIAQRPTCTFLAIGLRP